MSNSLLKTLFGCVFLPLLLAFLLLPVFSSSVSALELEGGGTIAPQNSSSYLRFGFTDPKTSPSPMLGNSIQWQNILGSQTVTQMGIKLSRALPNQGKNSLVSFNITWQTHHIQKINYFGMTFRDFTILWDSCYEGPVLNVTGDINATVTCTYIGLSHAPGQDLLETTEYTQIFNTVSYPNKTADYTLLVSPIYYRQVNTDGLSSSDRTWLQQQLGTSSSQSIIDKLDDILQAIPAGASQADIEQAVEDANNASYEAQREGLNDEASGYQQDLQSNSDQQAIDNKMTSIMSIITNFVTAITHPVVSTCILPMDFRNYTGAGFYEVDLCHLSPPAGITNVLNVIFIFFVLGLAYSAIRSVIQMYKEVIDG